MSVADPITVQVIDDVSREWSDYAHLHCLQTNKTRSNEWSEAGGEQSGMYVTFKVRWNKLLPPIECDTTRYRLIWRGHTFDIRGYDDYMYQHMFVDIKGVCIDG